MRGVFPSLYSSPPFPIPRVSGEGLAEPPLQAEDRRGDGAAAARGDIPYPRPPPAWSLGTGDPPLRDARASMGRAGLTPKGAGGGSRCRGKKEKVAIKRRK